MNSVLVLVLGIEEVTSKLVNYIMRELPKAYVISLGSGDSKLQQKLKSASSKSEKVIVVNTDCQNSQILDKFIELFSQHPIHILNFCLNCCPTDHIKDVLCLPPYITTARMLRERIKSIIGREEFKIGIELSKEDAELLAKIHNIDVNQLKDSMNFCLSEKERSFFTIGISKKTEITIQSLGMIDNSKKQKKILVKISGLDINTENYCTQIVSIISTILLNTLFTNLEPMVTFGTGFNEGLYTYFMSKLVTYGFNVIIKIEEA